MCEHLHCRCARPPSRARIATPHSTSMRQPTTWLRPATEPGEDRNYADASVLALRSRELRPATEPGEDRNNKQVDPFDTDPRELRPATEPGEDRNTMPAVG